MSTVTPNALTGFKRMAPEDFFAEGMGAIQKALPPSEFEHLDDALSIRA